MSRNLIQTWSLPKPVAMLLALVFVFAVGSVDYLTGRDVAVSAFYLVPICWACWMVGRWAGVVIAAVSTILWFVSDVLSGYVYPHPLVPYWNALTLLAFFLVFVYLLAAFKTAHYHLERTVAQRTAALLAEMQERKRLERAKLQAERLAMVGTMAAQMAHEVRNPLGSITLNLDLLQKEIGRLAADQSRSPEESDQLVQEVRQEIHRIQHVLEEYLQFARMPKPRLQPVEPNELLARKLDFMAGDFERKNVRLSTHFDPAAGAIQADGEQLWQATLNLIRNSLEAMPNGGELTVGTWRENGEVRLRVTDTGMGMTEDQLKQVFAPFYTTKPKGTGLGLALVQQIITDHGGHVDCESTSGKGCTFTLFLPDKKSP